MTLTEDVTSAMECSQPYLINQQVVVVPAAVADQYQSEDSLTDLAFAVEIGSAGCEIAAANGYNYTEVADQATALLEVASGTADAAIIDSLMAGAMIGEGTSYADLTSTVALTSEEYGVGFRKGSDLAAALNEFLDGKYADGSIQTLAETYGVQDALGQEETSENLKHLSQKQRPRPLLLGGFSQSKEREKAGSKACLQPSSEP